MSKLKEARSLIESFKEDEESDLDCLYIATGQNTMSTNGDDWTWKKERIKVYEYILKRLT